MITIIDGLMGSGKTYYAVDFIFNHKNDYSKIYTNIDSFKYQHNIKPLKFSYVLGILEAAKAIYDQEDTSDQDIWNYLFSEGFLNSSDSSEILPVLLVIDEAHNEFDKKNELLTWFITYHRHLFIDAILITQTFNLIHYSYHKLFESILHAIPSSRQLIGNKFKYQKHIKLPIQDGKFGTLTGEIYLKKDQEVFSMYQSGDKVRSKSLINKYLYYIIVFVAAGAFGFYQLINYLSPEPIEPIHKKSYNVDSNTVKTTSNHKLKGLTYLKVNCFSVSCQNKKQNINFNIDDLQMLLDSTNSKYLRSVKVSDSFANVYLLVSSDFINLFLGAKKNEKNNNGFSFLN